MVNEFRLVLEEVGGGFLDGRIVASESVEGVEPQFSNPIEWFGPPLRACSAA